LIRNSFPKRKCSNPEYQLLAIAATFFGLKPTGKHFSTFGIVNAFLLVHDINSVNVTQALNAKQEPINMNKSRGGFRQQLRNSVINCYHLEILFKANKKPPRHLLLWPL
jgi:hypothetical protein